MPGKKIIFSFSIIIITVLLFLSFSVFWNRQQIKPNEHEIALLEKELGSIKINNAKELLFLQNKVIGRIKHEICNVKNLSIDTIFKYRKGYCYDRSLILQKICIYNGLEIRPVFLYFRADSSQAKVFDLIRPGIPTHNIFEVNWKGKWYMVQTNKKQEKMKTLEEYLSSGISVPSNTQYIRHLNNRNGRFISPSFIPDIY
jgi:hypothetical protein